MTSLNLFSESFHLPKSRDWQYQIILFFVSHLDLSWRPIVERVLATLLSALETHGGRKGVASLCIGGGEATAMAVELVD